VVSISERLRVGGMVGDKYRIERVLGSGGMGVVVAANHVLLGHSVAIKLVLPDAVNPGQSSARILHEARAAATLDGGRIARVLDVDTLADGTHYMVMERLVGRTLRSLLDEVSCIPWQKATDYALEACEALAEAHEAGIVHRDIKPANLYLVGEPRDRGTVRLLDFGVCRAITAACAPCLSDLDEQGFIGSPPYISPEQLACPDDADVRTDVWSLGIVMYECLTGGVPFQSTKLARLWQAILLDPVPSFERALGVPAALERIVQRCLEKDPNARFPTVRALAEQLADVRAQAPSASPFALDRRVRVGAEGAEPGATLDLAAYADLPRPWSHFPTFYLDW
jgi:serine/threonine-protein kinase